MPLNRKFSLNPEKTLAILIGIEQYEDFARVDPAPNNVRELARMLADEQVLGLPRTQIKTLIGGRSAAIKEALFDIFESLHGQDLETLILYFVGHGYRRPDGKYYLAAEDSKKRLLRLDGSSGIAFDTLKQIILGSGIPQKLIFLDACYSGTTTLSDEKLDSMRLKGTYTIASSAAREVSYFDPEHSHTLFTGELLNILGSGLEGVGERIRLDELYTALKCAVRKRNPKMSPQQLGSEEITGGNYLFCKNRQYNEKAAQRKEINLALGLGDEALKAKDLQQAEYQFLRARHLAEEQELLPDFQKEIQQRMEKLRYAQELQEDWKGEEAVAEETAETGSEVVPPTAWLRKGSNQLILAVGLVLVVGVVLWLSLGGGGAKKKGGGIAGDSLSTQGQDAKPMSGSELIDQMAKNMISVPGGAYTRGCTFEQADDCETNEQHLAMVQVQGFQLNRYEVTQRDWRAVMGSDPEELNFPGCDLCPVERVTWEEVHTFLQNLNQMTGKQYRLPTESEWEYAARGGSRSRDFKYAGSDKVGEVAWYEENAEGKTHPVGQLAPNELGLYDMSGNVYEWCQDHYHDSYEGLPIDGSAWVDTADTLRSLRGGSWSHPEQRCRVSSRNRWRPDKRYKDAGLRLAHGK